MQSHHTQLFPADSPAITMHRRKIRLIEGNAKCRHLKKWTFKGTLQQVFICMRARKPYPPPLLHTVYLYTEHLLTQRRVEVRWSREKVRRATVHKAGSMYKRDWLNLQSINSDKYLPQKHFVLMSIYLLSPCHAQTKNKKSWFVSPQTFPSTINTF